MLAVFCFQLGGELSLLLYPPFPSLSLPPRYMIDLLAKCVCVWLLLLGCYLLPPLGADEHGGLPGAVGGRAQARSRRREGGD